jgi:hypothetical protein
LHFRASDLSDNDNGIKKRKMEKMENVGEVSKKIDALSLGQEIEKEHEQNSN